MKLPKICQRYHADPLPLNSFDPGCHGVRPGHPVARPLSLPGMRSPSLPMRTYKLEHTTTTTAAKCR